MSKNPRPIRYCPVWHGAVFFPDLLASCLRSDLDPILAYQLVRKHLCKSCAALEIACDPSQCRSAVADGIFHGPGGVVQACKRQWTDYHDRTLDFDDNDGHSELVDLDDVFE